MIRKSDSMPMYTMLCETSNPREAVSRASKFVIVATIGLLLALIEQVVGYSTNYWMKKGFGSSVYHTEGLWKTCYCSSSCYCDTRDSEYRQMIFYRFIRPNKNSRVYCNMSGKKLVTMLLHQPGPQLKLPS